MSRDTIELLVLPCIDSRGTFGAHTYANPHVRQAVLEWNQGSSSRFGTVVGSDCYHGEECWLKNVTHEVLNLVELDEAIFAIVSILKTEKGVKLKQLLALPQADVPKVSIVGRHNFDDGGFTIDRIDINPRFFGVGEHV